MVPASAAAVPTPPAATRIGPNDQLDVVVLEAAELNRSVRVAGTGTISLPLLGEVRAAGMTPRELEIALETSLRQRYIRDPHVSVQISEMRSRAVSVVGAVVRPGVFQLAEPRPLLEVIALAGGLGKEAGEGIVIVRGGLARGGADSAAGPSAAPATAATVDVSLRELLGSGAPQHNVPVYPGDIVKVTPAGLVYVVGEVRKPGGFLLDSRAGLTVLQAIALGEGLAARAARGRTTIIRTSDSGERIEIPVDLGEVLTGKAPDPRLQARDVVYVPNSAVRSVTIGAVDALVRMVTIRSVF